MNKYETGRYHVHLFDRHGTKAKTLLANSFTEAETIGRDMTQQPPHASYAVTRVLANSLDRAYPWQVRGDVLDIID